jgi:uncharacterized protein YndB with AHSA1/START domain
MGERPVPAVTVSVSRGFDARAEIVFDAWFDAAHAGRWLFATPSGDMVRATIDARVGGTFIFIDRRDGEDVAHTGEYLAIERPQHLAFDFAVPQYSPDITRVSIDIVPRPSGCELTLTHQGVAPEYAERAAAGWRSILDGLAATLETVASVAS